MHFVLHNLLLSVYVMKFVLQNFSRDNSYDAISI